MSEIWIEIEEALEAGVDARSIAKNLLIPIEWVYIVDSVEGIIFDDE